MKYFLIIGLPALLAACNSNKQEAAFQEQVKSLQLNFKKPHQPANDWVLDSLQSIRTKQWYAVAERKIKESGD